MATVTKKESKSKISDIIGDGYILILLNDDSISFEHVIECLVKICGHSQEAANQCALIVHTRGRCDIKKGGKEEMYSMRDKLSSCKLTVEVESII